MKYNRLAISRHEDLRFGIAPNPLATRSGMVIGGGVVYPELNFTLPTMMVEARTMPQVRAHYEQIVEGALRRAAELDAPGVVVEFETLPPMAEHPQWGLDVVKILLTGMQDANARYGLKTVLRVTPNDNREMQRPPIMRSGPWWQSMLDLFESSAAEGAELLSIESTGGKELHDDALTQCDIAQVIFSQCILGVRDMRFLWSHIKEISDRHGVHSAGDTACGFANTAMALAEQKLIPRAFAAVVRAVSAVRSLVAYECGAVGPGKDCGYENIYLKAITGYPMAMEGKTASCAHLSVMGNISAAACDTWSNESVQNLKLLGGMAPTCYMEQLTYDCRLMNVALDDGELAARQYQSLLVRSDARLDPQAFVLSPAAAIDIAGVIVASDSHYHAGRAVAGRTAAMLREAYATGELRLDPRELPFLDMIEQAVETMPDDESAFIEQMMAVVDVEKFAPAEYDLAASATRSASR
jgi:methanol--5-hydroxybenzimidazolylcobamide Co-methyltransferase